MSLARYLPEFWPDVSGAAAWLDSESPGLGAVFGKTVVDAIGLIVEHPRGFTVIAGPIRQFVIRRFHFLLFYEIVDDAVLFLGVVHGARDLSDWLQQRRPTS